MRTVLTTVNVMPPLHDNWHLHPRNIVFTPVKTGGSQVLLSEGLS